MNKLLSVLFGLAVLVVSGVVHGLWAQRWSKSELLDEAVARVALVPMEIGEWKGEDIVGEEPDFDTGRPEGWWMRSYSHPRRKGPVVVVLMCGRARPMAVHTPEVCFRGAFYETLQDPVLYTVTGELGAGLGQFRTAQFAKLLGPTKDVRLFWAWNATGSWQAPAGPRWEFGGQPFLYKLYLSHEFPKASDRLNDDMGVEFLRQFLPELEKALFPSCAAKSVTTAE